MNALSCSSSTTISPSSANGRNNADLAPTTTFAAPVATARYVALLTAGVSSECHTAGIAPNRLKNRCRNCTERAISGSSTSAWRPAASACATASRYTSVLPEPVTPSSSVTPNFCAATAARNAAAAAA